MAAHLWRAVLGMQLALALVITAVATHALHVDRLAVACALGIATFIALQYLLGALILAASRPFAPPTLCAVLSEPVYFGLAEFAMASDARASSWRPVRTRPRRGPLLLVHGLACNSAVWRWLLPRLRAAGFDPIHAIDLEPITADIDVLATRVAREISELHRAQAQAPVTLLAHSMGGLVCRAALRQLDTRQVRRLVTIATPHHGAAIARLLRTPPVSQMRRDSSWLAQLAAEQEGRLPVPVTSIFSRDDNFVAPASSAELAGARLRPVSGFGHFGLLVSRRASAAVLRALRESP